jgi:DNA-directed RNA polymerase sigma subunit (sigma70/sigma32)
MAKKPTVNLHLSPRTFRIIELLDVSPRDKDIAKKVLSGETYASVGAHFGITPSRVSQVASTVLRKCRHPKFRDIE